VADQVRTRPRDRRASILAAARARFHRHGYSGTSLEDIAGDLGITAPALYRHFRGKDALYTAALESNLRHLEECVAEGSSADEVVRGLARVAVEHPTIGLLWNPDRRRRLTDPDGSIQRPPRGVPGGHHRGDRRDGGGESQHRLLVLRRQGGPLRRRDPPLPEVRMGGPLCQRDNVRWGRSCSLPS